MPDRVVYSGNMIRLFIKRSWLYLCAASSGLLKHICPIFMNHAWQTCKNLNEIQGSANIQNIQKSIVSHS